MRRSIAPALVALLAGVPSAPGHAPARAASGPVDSDDSTLFLCTFDDHTEAKALTPTVAHEAVTIASVEKGLRLVPGTGGGQALELGQARDGNVQQLAYVRYAWSNGAGSNIDVEKGAIEFDVRLAWDCGENISRVRRAWVDVRPQHGNTRDRFIVLSEGDTLEFLIAESDGKLHHAKTQDLKTWAKGTWHHVACTWNLKDETIAIWLDQRLAYPVRPAARGSTPREVWRLKQSEPTQIWIGSAGVVGITPEGRFAGPLDLTIDNLRISNQDRRLPGRSPACEEQIRQIRNSRLQARAELAALGKKIGLAQAGGTACSYSEAVREAGETGLRRVDGMDVSGSFWDDDAGEAIEYCRHIEQRAREEKARLDAIIAGRESMQNVPRLSVRGLRASGDLFVNTETEPLLLIGLRNMQEPSSAGLWRFFNLADWTMPPRYASGDPRRNALCGQVHLCWNEVKGNAARPPTPVVRGFAGHNWLANACIEDPGNRERIRANLADLRILREGEKPAYLYALLSAEDAYMCYCEASKSAFREWLKRKYGGDIEGLRAAWGHAAEGNFDVIQPPEIGRRDHPEAWERAAWYDWLSFNQERVTDFYAWLKAEVRRHFPTLPLCGGNNLPLTNSRQAYFGVDAEDLNARVNDVLQCETKYGLPTRAPTAAGSPYALDIFGEGEVDLQRSACPEKPATDLEYHAWYVYSESLWEQGGEVPRNYVSATIYRHFLHGVRAADLWVWRSTQTETALEASPVLPPASIEEAFRAGLDVQRLGSEIIALSRPQTPRIAVFHSDATTKQIHPALLAQWSMPTPYTQELENAYHAALFLGVPAGLVTERMACAWETAGWDRAARENPILLMAGASHVPARVSTALRKYVEAGGILVMTPRCWQYDEYGKPRCGVADIFSFQPPVMTGLPYLPDPFALPANDPDLVEKLVQDPGDGRIPGVAMQGSAGGILAGKRLEGVGLRQDVLLRKEGGNARTLATFADGRPAMVSVPIGEGRVVYSAMPLRPQSGRELIEGLMSELPAERSPERLVQLRDTNGSPTWGVEWRACDEPDATLVYAINLLSKPVEIQVNAGPGRKIAEMHDLLTGKVVDERFGLDSLQTVILRVKWMARQSS